MRLLSLLLLAGCATPSEPPSLQTYGAFNPVCVFFCRSTATSADLADSAQQNITDSSSVIAGAASE